MKNIKNSNMCLQAQVRFALFVFCIHLGLLLSAFPADSTVSVDPANKYAWSENAGWINFAPSNAGGGALLTQNGNSGYLSGYVWAENIGWIQLSYSSSGPYTNNSNTNWGVNSDSNGNLSGYAWSENAGWINFHPTGGAVTPVTINMTTGSLDGYAWGENIGYIHFKNTSPAYNVVFDLTTTTVGSNQNPSTYGASVTFTATVTGGSSPTGNVTFKDNGSAITGCANPVTLSVSAPYQATCATSSLSVGSHSITAVYSGDTDNAGSTSSSLTQTVNEPPPPPPPPPPPTATLSINPSGTVTSGQVVQIASNIGGINCTYNGTAPAGGTCQSSAQLYGTPVTLTAVLPMGTSIAWSGCNPPVPPVRGDQRCG